VIIVYAGERSGDRSAAGTRRSRRRASPSTPYPGTSWPFRASGTACGTSSGRAAPADALRRAD
jgi:hypothetical protein